MGFEGGGGGEEGLRLFTKAELIEKFGWEEYFVFALMLAISAGIGLFFCLKGQKSNAEFLMGGKNMGTVPMTMSLVARLASASGRNLAGYLNFFHSCSFMSAITLLGTPAEMYVSGTQYIALVLAYPFVMGAAAHLYLPVFFKLGVSTSYEVNEAVFKQVEIDHYWS